MCILLLAGDVDIFTESDKIVLPDVDLDRAEG